MYKKVAVFILFSFPPLLCAQSVRLQSFDHTVSWVDSSRVGASAIALGALGATEFYLGSSMQRRACNVVRVTSEEGQGAVKIARWLVLAGVTVGAHNYLETFLNKSVWPQQAAWAVEQMLLDYALLYVVNAQFLATFSIPSPQLYNASGLIKKHLDNATEWKYQVASDETLACFAAFQEDLEVLMQDSLLDEGTTRKIVARHPELAEHVTGVFAICARITQIRQQKNPKFLEEAQELLKQMSAHLEKIYVLEENIRNNSFIFRTAAGHCKRIARVQTAVDISRGFYEIGKWKAQEWWQGEAS